MAERNPKSAHREHPRAFRREYAEKPLELPEADGPSIDEALECARLGVSLVKLREMRSQQRGVRKAETRDALRGKKVGTGYSFGAHIPGLDADEPAISEQPTVVSVRPISLSLPWSALLPDNRRVKPLGGDRIGTTSEWRDAKAKAIGVILRQLPEGWTPIPVPMRVEFVLVEPNRHQKRDILNYQKLACDAMRGLVYVDDSLIDKALWDRGEPDIDRPRADITVTPI